MDLLIWDTAALKLGFTFFIRLTSKQPLCQVLVWVLSSKGTVTSWHNFHWHCYRSGHTGTKLQFGYFWQAGFQVHFVPRALGCTLEMVTKTLEQCKKIFQWCNKPGPVVLMSSRCSLLSRKGHCPSRYRGWALSPPFTELSWKTSEDLPFYPKYMCFL